MKLRQTLYMKTGEAVVTSRFVAHFYLIVTRKICAQAFTTNCFYAQHPTHRVL